MEIKEIQGIVDAGFKELDGKVDEKMTSFLSKQKEAMVKEIEEKGYTSKEDVTAMVDGAKKEFEAIILEIKKGSMKPNDEKRSFKEFLADAMEESKTELSNLASKKSRDGVINLKAAGDMNPGAFGTGAYLFETTDRERSRYDFPYAPLWLRNVLPNTSTSGSTIQYLRENGGTGAAAVWDGTGDIENLTAKPGTTSNFELITKTVQWIAGITRVKREMLDDIAWLQGYLSRQLLLGKRGLWVAENTQIYSTLTDAANSVVYDGTKTIPVEVIYDAAFGQLRDNYYNPTTILMNHRDVVNLIALNKAGGTGVYDLPSGTVSIIGNQLILGGVPVLGVPNIDPGEFVVFDRNATEFVNRMSPEIRFFEEDRDNVTKNLVTVRAEERIATLVYDEDAVVTGTFATS